MLPRMDEGREQGRAVKWGLRGPGGGWRLLTSVRVALSTKPEAVLVKI